MEQGQLQLNTPPSFCQYTDEACDKDLSRLVSVDGLFLFGSDPKPIAATIEAAREELEVGEGTWRSWMDFDISGQLIFCEICKGIRGAANVFADVTTLNQNLMFEIGFWRGRGLPVNPKPE
jgi:hypothetical protein